MSGTATPIASAPTGNALLDALLWGTHWSSGGPVTVIGTYLAGGRSGESVLDGTGGRIWALSPTTAESAAVSAALTALEAVCNIDFRSVTRAADADLVWASVGDADAMGVLGWTNPPGTGTAHGGAQALVAVNRDAYQSGPGGYVAGSLDYASLLHQLGLALGLDYPDGGLAALPDADGAMNGLGLDQGIFTMMSWNDGWQTGPMGLSPSPVYGFQAGPMALDIAALQALYGANMATRTGNDTYVLPAANIAGTGWTCLWDAGGTDRIQGAAGLSNVIDLRAATLQAGPGGGGFASHAAGIWGGLTIAHGASIEEEAGGALADHLTGNAVANLLLGLDGADTLLGEGGNDTLDGGAGADRLDGGAGDDTLRGGDGDDRLEGGAGLDRLEGGVGHDIYILTDADTVAEAAGAGTDEVRAIFSHALAANLENLVLLNSQALEGTGNAAANRLTGNGANNVLRGLEGNDALDGGAGADRLEGGAGDDTLRGGDGDDLLEGGTGLDRHEGGAGNDIYILPDGDTVVEAAGAGLDEVRAALAHTLGAHVENLLLTGTLALSGTGNTLANRLTGNGAANVLRGLEGDDTLHGGGGADTLEGGAGHDIYILADADTVVEAAGGGTDEVRASLTHTLGANLENLLFTGAQACDGTGNALGNRLTGNEASNVLRGLDGSDTLSGAGGADRLEGGAGDDSLAGGAGLDTLSGGLGHDIYILADADTVVEAAGSGTDEVRAAIAHTLAANVENLLLTGNAALSGTGNALGNRLTGNAGQNVLWGLDGDDTLDGGAGLDRLEGGMGNDIYLLADSDTVVEGAGAGTDQVRSAVTHTLAANVEALLLLGTHSCDGTGNAGANRLTGNAASNALWGREGNDHLGGGAGDDRLDGDAGDDLLDGGAGLDRLEGDAGNDLYILADGDTVVEGADGGTDEVRSSVSHKLAANVENLLLTGAQGCAGTGNSGASRLTGNAGSNALSGLDGADSLDGGAGADRLEGSRGDDALKGGAGADVLSGGAGADVLSGGLGHDSFLFSAPSEGGDTLLDFHSAAGDDDRLQIGAAGFGGGLRAGTTLMASQFQARADNLAQDADDRFVFRTTDQSLWFDGDGNGPGGPVLVADLQAGATLASTDILILA